jgi:ribonuclease P protein component
VNEEGDYPAQILISVSKRNFKQAVERNRIKRLIRESYRKNKEKLYHQRADRQQQLLIGLIYTAKTILSYAEIESKIILILQRLNEQDEQATG